MELHIAVLLGVSLLLVFVNGILFFVAKSLQAKVRELEKGIVTGFLLEVAENGLQNIESKQQKTIVKRKKPLLH